MSGRKFISPLIKLCVLVALIFLLLHFRTTHQPAPPPVGGGDNDEDDVQYAPTVSVSVTPVRKADLRSYVIGYGLVEPEPAGKDHPAASATLTAPLTALVSEVSCIEGQHVDSGQTLVKLDSRLVQAAIDRARRALAAADEDVERLTHPTDAHAAGDQQWLSRARRDQDRAHADLDDATAQQAVLSIKSPIAGTITQLQVRPGEVITPASPAITVTDTSRLVIAVSIPAAQLASIRLGQVAQLVGSSAPADTARSAPQTQPSAETPPNARVDADAQTRPIAETEPAAQTQRVAQTRPTTIEGSVVFIDPSVDPRTGMGSVDVRFPADLPLRVGDFASVRIVTDEHHDCLAVPATSIVRDADGNPGVSLAVRDFQWAFRHPVHVGLADGGLVEVEAEGLNTGDFVVTTGAYTLPEKSRIHVLHR